MKIILSFLLILFSELHASHYFRLDNETVATSDDIFNDPFLALRTKTTGTETSYSTKEAWTNLENFHCPEWQENLDPLIYFFTDIDEKTFILNESHIFDHSNPTFTLATSAASPKHLYWQISSSSDFTTVVSNFDEVTSFKKCIEIPLISQTFLNPETFYYFRAKVKNEAGWTDWSAPFEFQVIKPEQPKKLIFLSPNTLQWKPDPDQETTFYLFAHTESDFIPSLYSEDQDNLIIKTKDNEAVIDEKFGYVRIIAEKRAVFSIPSELAVNKDNKALLEAVDTSLNEPVVGYQYNKKVSQEIWNSLSPYFLPYGDPLRHKLDKIFKIKKRVIEDVSSLKKAGFKHPEIRKWTRLIVTSHSDLNGYIVKLYTDSQHPHRGLPEHYFWVKRITGAELIRNSIMTNNLQSIFKVPKKWIYPLPERPSPSSSAKYRKNFILVEEDMHLLNDKENARTWQSAKVSKPLLTEVFNMIERHGLIDCGKPDNIPFSKDGRIAFIDTQTFHQWPVGYHRLMHHLTEEMKLHLTILIHEKK